MKRTIQIGVMGSAADLGYTQKNEEYARELGYYIAQNKCVLMFGAEKDSDSLSTIASRGAQEVGGLTVGVTYGKGLTLYDTENTGIVIASGLERGGGREMALVLSCDAIICLGGGSGTLTEILVAYQANIPIVALANTGGWSEKLINWYMDSRNRIKIEGANTPQEAVARALQLIDERKRQ